MQPRVIRGATDHKVAVPIVFLNHVDVVNLLPSAEGPSQHLLRLYDMHWLRTASALLVNIAALPRAIFLAVTALLPHAFLAALRLSVDRNHLSASTTARDKRYTIFVMRQVAMLEVPRLTAGSESVRLGRPQFI